MLYFCRGSIVSFQGKVILKSCLEFSGIKITSCHRELLNGSRRHPGAPSHFSRRLQAEDSVVSAKKRKAHVGGWLGAQEQKVPCFALQNNHFITLDAALSVFFLPILTEDETLCEACVGSRAGFLGVAPWRENAGLRFFSFCSSTPFQYLFFLTNKQCLWHSELQIPSNISGTWREACGGARKGCVQVFGNMQGTARLWVFSKFRPTRGC